jgi:ribose transport system substrate-binding protein
MCALKRPLALATVVLFAGLMLAACGSSSSPTSSSNAAASGTASGSASSAASGGSSIKIGFINLANSVPFALDVEKGVEAVAKQDHVQVVTCDSNLSAQTAINCAAEFKSEGVQGIADFQQDQTASPRVCAAGPQVPVVAVDIPQKPCQRVFFGANNYKAGYVDGLALGQFAKQKWSCKIDAVISINTPVNALLVVRENGELAGVRSQCPAFKVVHVTPTATTTDATIAPFTNTLTRLPGMHHLLVLGDNDDTAIGAIKAAQSAGRLGDIYVGGEGADPTAWPYICGTTPFKNWVADSGYFPERYGKYIVPLLVGLIQGKNEPANVYMDHLPVNRQNIKTFYPNACG